MTQGLTQPHRLRNGWVVCYYKVMTTKLETYTSEYGTRIIGPVDQTEYSYRRRDRYTCADTGETFTDALWAAGLDDVSNRHGTYPTGYDSRCGWCWLGYGHTKDAHAARIAKK